MNLVDKVVDNPRGWIEKIEKFVSVAELLGYLTRGFVVMLIWGMLAVHFGVPTLGYWYAVALVYVVDVFQYKPTASERYKNTINVQMEYQDNLDRIEEIAENVKRHTRLENRRAK